MGALVEGHTLLDRFVLVRPLGRGGAGEVWLARDSRDADEVALKIFRDPGPDQRVRLENECARASLLQHPSVVRVHGFHSEGDLAFIVMEAVHGEPLDRIAGDCSFAECLPGLRSLAAALESAHRADIVHRDVKVHNVLRDSSGQFRLTDFGSSACHGEADSAGGGGSLYSMSPQQLAGRPAAPADDVYAFGVLVYELFSGKPPFYPDITADRIRDEDAPPLDVAPPLPRVLIDLVARMLNKNAAARPTMADVRVTLDNLAVPTEAAVHSGFESIAPISRRPVAQASQRPAFQAGRRRTVPAGVAIAALAALIVLAVAVFWGLPRIVAPPEVPAVAGTAQDGGSAEEKSAEKAPDQEPGLAPFELAELTERRRAAQNKFDAFFEIKRELERVGVESWGGEPYAAALEIARGGDELFRSRDYEKAGEAYTAAAEQLSAVIDSVDMRYKTAVAEGWKAFQAGDGATAAARFELALSIDPDSSDAKRGAKRAAVLDQVLENIRTAESHAQSGRPQDAIAAYRAALKLDGDYASAQRAIDRISAGIGDARFRRAMSDGLSALNRGDRAAAEAAFRRAESLRPGSTEAADGLAQISESRRGDEIERLRTEASAHVANEAWDEAAAAYAAIRKLDDTLVFAREGEQRSLEMQDLLRQMDALIADPASLRPQAKYEDANALLARARVIENKGSRLREATIGLARVLRDARIPVSVRFESDNQTEVVVYHVDRMGQFSAREMELLPGRYTAVGTRAGYRDVRQEFVVLAGEPPPPVVVRCEEKI